MKRLTLSLFALACLCGAAPAQTFTSVQWGVNRADSPWQIGVADQSNTFQPFFTMPATGGGPLLLPSACPTPTNSSLGCINAISSVSHEWVQFIDTSGNQHLLQPAASDLSNGTTGSGAVVLATSPALTTPNLGTPSAAVLTHATGLPVSTGISGLGTGVATALAVNVGSAGAPVINGGVLGTPSSGNAANLTGLPIAGLTGLGTGVATALGTASNAVGGFVSVPNTDSCVYQNNASAAAGCVAPNSTLQFDGSGKLGLAAIADKSIFGNVSGASGVPSVIPDPLLETTDNTFGIETYFPNANLTGNAQQLVLNNTSFSGAGLGGLYSFGAVNIKGYQAFIGYSDTASLVSPTGTPQSTAGGYFIGDNDYPGSSATPNAYGNYTEGRSQFAGMFTTGHESDCENTSSGTDSIIPTPNNIFGASPGVVCFGQWLYPGGTKSPTGKYDVSAAVGIQGIPGALNTDAQWKKGIVFGDDSVRPISGHSEAIDLAENYEVDWYGATDATVLRTYSDGATWFNTGNVQLSSANVLEWNGDTGISRDQAGALYIGNGTAGDSSGALVLASMFLTSILNLQQQTPTSSSASCQTGQFAQDASFFYECTATNTWKRAALSTF